MRLQGKVALVTGASRGIGRCIALALAREGSKVVVNYAIQEAKAREVVEAIAAMGGEGIAIRADVSNLDEVQAMVEQVLERFGDIDVLVNNAGITDDALLVSMSPQQWRRVMDVNAGGTFNCMHAVLPHMLRERKGSIINISSVMGTFGWPGQANYAASKAAVEALTRCAATELGRFNIRVNAVALGMVATEMSADARERVGDKLLRIIPARRFATPDECCGIVTFLASDDSSYITGEVIGVRGGLGMGAPFS